MQRRWGECGVKRRWGMKRWWGGVGDEETVRWGWGEKTVGVGDEEMVGWGWGEETVGVGQQSEWGGNYLWVWQSRVCGLYNNSQQIFLEKHVISHSHLIWPSQIPHCFKPQESLWAARLGMTPEVCIWIYTSAYAHMQACSGTHFCGMQLGNVRETNISMLIHVTS